MKRRIAVLIVLLLVAGLAQSHEFWLQPKKFRFKVGEEMKIDFMVGENFTGTFWDMKRHKVEKAEVHAGSIVKNVMKDVKPTEGNNLGYKFDKEGTHLVGVESNFAFIELEGKKFNEYLKEDGIDNILDERTRENKLEQTAHEYYKRYAKLLVQAGDKTDETYRKRLGFRYEIIPMVNPYTLKSGDYLECRVLWEGRPAPGALVKVWGRAGNRNFLQDIYTESDGTVKFPISNSGPWMVSSVRMIKADKEGADYQSLWASLVFAVE
ncbi:MAG: DUF4198 domain-containing protein [Cyclobacteriaceae bacterium]|nr:DUF4198 domain-containing protein [Cyclobacteriaceae bacterium]